MMQSLTRQTSPLPTRAPAMLWFSAFVACSPNAASAATGSHFKVLLSFDSTDGATPAAPLLADTAGNLYGTAENRGAHGYGVVFEITAAGKKKTLYSFKGGNDGATPAGNLAVDENGNIYGATFEGGSAGDGTVFEITPDGTETVLHTFAGGSDGKGPSSGVLRDKSGRLWGATVFGGASNDGTVFTVSPSGKETILHAFTGTDGEAPEAGVLRDAAGNLYGTTLEGGAAAGGTVYKLASDGTYKVLYSFQGGQDGALPSGALVADSHGNMYSSALAGGNDGGEPYGMLVRTAAGDLFGTTSHGGKSNGGVVYKRAPNGDETVLHSFTTRKDGAAPEAGLIAAPAVARGYLFGTTTGGGKDGLGAVFKIEK